VIHIVIYPRNAHVELKLYKSYENQFYVYIYCFTFVGKYRLSTSQKRISMVDYEKIIWPCVCYDKCGWDPFQRVSGL